MTCASFEPPRGAAPPGPAGTGSIGCGASLASTFDVDSRLIAILKRALFAACVLGFDLLIDADCFGPGGRELEGVGYPDSSSHRQIGSFLFALVSFARPAEISFFATFCAEPLFSVGGGHQAAILALGGDAQHNQLRVGEFDGHGRTLRVFDGGQANRGPSPTPSPDPPGLRVCRAAPSRRRNIHTHAPFRTECQSFLRCRDTRLTISRKQGRSSAR